MRAIPIVSLALFGVTASTHLAAASWTVRLEEPTGLYRRTEEIVSVPLARLGGAQGPFTVVDAEGRELPCQVTETHLLFPASLIPGELPVVHVANTAPADAAGFENPIQARRLGLNRVELGNDRFRVAIDLHAAAIVEAFSLSAESPRRLNFVETSPESREALVGDIHADAAQKFSTEDVIAGDPTGWTSLGATGPLTELSILENGPLRGRVRLGRAGETWEFTWTAHSAALHWKARKGFRFAAVSASPYLPFNRCVDGSEYVWPTGPGEDEPPDHDIRVRDWSRLPGGHAVYYRHDEDYGALGVVATDTNLTWKGVGSRRFEATGSDADTAIALTFPRWRRGETVLEARREYRVLRQPILVQVQPANAPPPAIRKPAPRVHPPEIGSADTAPAAFEPTRLSLSGDWELMFAEKGEGPPASGWRSVKVPGTAHVQWLPADQLYTRAAEWISGKDWWYRKRFRVPDSYRGRQRHLDFEAADYYADVRLNGEDLGRHEGYQDPFSFDVSDALRFGDENELLVRVWTPVHYYWKHRPYTIKGSYGGVDQKPDDITALGITRPVWLRATDPVWIEDVAVATWLTDPGADVEVEIELDGQEEQELQLELTLSPRNFAGGGSVVGRSPVTARHTRVTLPVKDPQLWWTRDHGRPNLYTLDVRLRNAAGQVMDGRSLAVGIREIENIGWHFYQNRKRFFVRGSNYYYHLYMSEMNRAAYARDLELMLGMNLNLIRLHCHFSNREFYELADEAGVLIWQDFLEAWYPQDRGFSLRAATLYDPLIRSVRNHPSIALWATSDEEDFENYRDLTKHLAPRPAFLDPQRRTVVRSTGRFGDAHVYHGWYDGTIWEYTKMTEAFVSELGATSLPNYETLISFMPNQWPIGEHRDEWIWRRLQIGEALRAWGQPGELTLQQYIPQTQAYVARLFQIALERMRRLKYDPAGGILHFHAIDIWPSVTMAAIDFNRVPTKTFYTVQRSFAPVAALFEYDRDRWGVGDEFRCGLWAVNDRWEAVPDATVLWQIRDPAGQIRQQGEWKLTLAEDSSRKLGEATWRPDATGNFELRAEVRNAGGEMISENLYEFSAAPNSP